MTQARHKAHCLVDKGRMLGAVVWRCGVVKVKRTTQRTTFFFSAFLQEPFLLGLTMLAAWRERARLEARKEGSLIRTLSTSPMTAQGSCVCVFTQRLNKSVCGVRYCEEEKCGLLAGHVGSHFVLADHPFSRAIC